MAAVTCRSAVRSTTTYFLVVLSSAFFSSTCTPMLNAHRTGTSTRLMTNALVLTAALYSRAATAHTLGSMALAPLVLGPRDADENLLQRRPGQLKVPHGAARQ